MTDDTRNLIFGIAAPALITGALLAPGWLHKPPEGTQREPWPWRIPLALGLPVSLAFLALYGWPSGSDHWRTAAFAPLLGLAASLILLFRRSWLRPLVVVLIAAGLAVFVLPFTRSEHWTIKILPGAASLALIGAVEPIASRRKGPALTFPLLIAVASAAALVLISGSIKLTVPLVALAVSTFVLALYSVLRRNLSLTRGPLFIILPTTATAILFRWLEERFYEGPIPPAAFALVALAPLALWLGELPWLRSRRLWFAVTLRTLLIAAICGAGVYLAKTAKKPEPSNSTEDLYRSTDK